MRAEIVAVGTELLLGDIVDTNSAYLARRLRAMGIDLHHISQVGDNLGRLRQSLEQALERADIVLTTGGLGPTEDDLTREAIAAVLGEEPRVDPALERELREWFAGRGFEMPERNRKQAWLIPSAKAIPNPNGTAPGWWVRRDGREIVAMPGVPREMTPMWDDHVEPALVARSGEHLVVRVLKVLGVGESAVEERLGELTRSTFPTVATYAKADGVHVRIAAKSPDRARAAAAVATTERAVRERFGAEVWGADDETLRGLIGERLRANGWRLAIRESLSGGAIAAALTEDGLPEWFAGASVRDGQPPDADVLLEVNADDRLARINVRTPRGSAEREVRYGSVVEGRRRATLMSLDLLRRSLEE